MKTLISIVILALIAGGIFVFWNPSSTPATENDTTSQTQQDASRTEVSEGAYVVNTQESEIRWSGKKPLIDGYINSGTLQITDGSIDVVDNEATGTFTVDMNTLTVSNTAKKPGQESALEGHLKGERWFNVEEFPTATFTLLEVTPRANSDTTFTYDVRGELTMKGETGEITFPAMIYETADGVVRAEADFEFDRTQWGITSGSSSLFDNLADNAISDMVAMSFVLIAHQQ